MSSFTRSLQKRAMRRAGYVRQTSRVEQDKNGAIRIVQFKRGEGPVLTPDGAPWNGGKPGASFGPSCRWPRIFPGQTNPKAKDLLARLAREAKRRAV